MDLNPLLTAKGIDPRKVIVMRHRPSEPRLAKVIGWLAEEKPDIFNAYQGTHGPTVENAMKKLSGDGYLASFIAYGAGKALFIGLYRIGDATPMTKDEYDNHPANGHLFEFGMNRFTPSPDRPKILYFNLALTEHYAEWKGKLVVKWPPPERAWYRRAENNVMSVIAIHEESALKAGMPDWDAINLTWDELGLLPANWRNALSHWRGIYYIFDESDGKGYVGSAYGKSNIYGRWSEYAVSGHGGNKHLKNRDPRSFRFTILQRVSPDMDSDDVTRLEASWKERLHTRQPFGLNDN